MQFADVSRVRRIVGVIESGENFVEALQELAMDRGISTGWVQATGHFEVADIQSYDAAGRRLGPARVVTQADVVHLSGSISLDGGVPYFDAYVVLNSRGEISAGRLRAAKAALVEFVFDTFEGVAFERQSDATTGLSAWKPTLSMIAEPAAAAPLSGWAAAAAASESSRFAQTSAAARKPLSVASEPAFVPPPIPERKRDAAAAVLDDEPTPAAGDWVSHKQFGLCLVEGEEESGGGLIVRLPNGVRKSLHLDYLRVLPARHDGDRVIYPLEPRKR